MKIQETKFEEWMRIEIDDNMMQQLIDDNQREKTLKKLMDVIRVAIQRYMINGSYNVISSEGWRIETYLKELMKGV